jgi:curved DNA-binding protein CbpA
MNPYDLLDVPRDADEATIKKAFRQKAKEAHPDREDGDAELMSQLNQAKDILLDPEKRARYDATGETGSARTDEAMALELLLTLMSELLTDHKLMMRFGNVRKALTNGLSNRTTEIALAIEDANEKLGHIEKTRKQVKAKDGKVNHFDTLCGTYIAGFTKHIGEMRRDLEITAVATKMLKSDYEFTESDMPQGMFGESFLLSIQRVQK